MTSTCNICGSCSGHQQLLTDTLYEYSFSRFVEQYFYNDRLRSTASTASCSHCPLRDATRWFHMADGSIIQFEFQKQDVFTLDLVNVKQQNNNLEAVRRLCGQKANRIRNLIRLKNALFNSNYSTVINFLDEKLVEMQAEAGPASRLSSAADVPRPHANSLSDPLNAEGVYHRLSGVSEFGNILLEGQALTRREGAFTAAPEESDSTVQRLAQLKDLMLDQMLKVHDGFNKMCTRFLEALKTFEEALAKETSGAFEKHFMPLRVQTVNLIERKFVVNYLSHKAVVSQYSKMFVVILTLIDFRQSVTRETAESNHPDREQKLAQLSALTSMRGASLMQTQVFKNGNEALVSLDQQGTPTHVHLASLPLLALRLKDQPKAGMFNTYQHAKKKQLIEFESLKEVLSDLAQDCHVEFDEHSSIQEAWQSFFLLRSNAPIVSSEKMFLFLAGLFGTKETESRGLQEFLNKENLSEAELKGLYLIGHKQICLSIKSMMSQLQAVSDSNTHLEMGGYT